MSLNESIVEDAALEWFGELGYAIGHGPHIAPGEAAAERDSFGEVILVARLRDAILSIVETHRVDFPPARKPDPDFEWLAVSVDPATFQIQQLVAFDRQGGRSTFAFRNLRENRRPADTTFVFRIPKGVDVINQ